MIDKKPEIKEIIKSSSYINTRTSIELKLKYEQNPLPKKKAFKFKDSDNWSKNILKEKIIINCYSKGNIFDDEEERKILNSKYIMHT